MEFLIYNQAHWMDALKENDITEYIKKYPDFQYQYDMRYQKGDIVEVRLDGYWTGEKAKGYNRKAFALVVCSLQEDSFYLGESEYNTEKKAIKKRRYSLDIEGLALDENKKVEIIPVQMINLLTDKSTLSVSD